jgi:hypothetical protein
MKSDPDVQAAFQVLPQLTFLRLSPSKTAAAFLSLQQIPGNEQQ